MGVNCDTFRRETQYIPYRGTEPLRLFCCARLNPGKGFSTLFDALRILKEAGSDVLLTIAGDDDVGGIGYRNELERLIVRLGILNEVLLLGAVAEEEVRKQLEVAHVFVLASLTEGVPVALMEAMAMQLPVVATRVGGIPELVADGISGVLVEPSNPADLVKAIIEVATNATVAIQLGSEGRMRVKAKYDHRASAERIVSMLQLARD